MRPSAARSGLFQPGVAGDVLDDQAPAVFEGGAPGRGPRVEQRNWLETGRRKPDLGCDPQCAVGRSS